MNQWRPNIDSVVAYVYCYVCLFLTAAPGINVASTPQHSFINEAPSNSIVRYAVFSILNQSQVGFRTVHFVLGHGTKAAGGSPLFRGTNAWEHNIDNGYSSVLYDGNDTFGLGKYRVYYVASDPSFGGSIPGESSGSATLYATSSDGLSFVKPSLGRVSFQNSTNNNILWDGTTSVAVFDDIDHDPNASSRFKAWGNLPGLATGADLPSLGYTAQLGGSAVSANGLNFTDYRRLQNPSSSKSVKDTWRFDAQASLYFDHRRQQYVGTMRAFRPCSSCGSCPIWWQPHGGCQADLGSTCTATQCNHTVRAIGASLSTSANFSSTEWGPNQEIMADHTNPEHQFYSQVSWPFYNVYLAIVMVFDAVDPPNVFGKGKVHCELAWSTNGSYFERIAPGVDFIPHGKATAPGDPDNAFDSHICFASATPIKLQDEIRVYYMGGDGPHYSPPYPDPLHRNSSFGMMRLQPDRFVGVCLRPNLPVSSGQPSITSVPLQVSAPKLVVTADTATSIPESSITVSVISGGLVVNCGTLSGRNITDFPLSGCDDLRMDMPAVLNVSLSGDAVLYTVGFTH